MPSRDRRGKYLELRRRIPKMSGQRLGAPDLTLGNVRRSHTQGNQLAEFELPHPETVWSINQDLKAENVGPLCAQYSLQKGLDFRCKQSVSVIVSMRAL